MLDLILAGGNTLVDARAKVYRFHQVELSEAEYHLYHPTLNDVRKMHGRMTKDVRKKHQDAKVVLTPYLWTPAPGDSSWNGHTGSPGRWVQWTLRHTG